MRPPIGVEALRIPGTGSSSTVIDSSGPTCPGTQAPPTPFIPSVMLILMPDAGSVTVVASPDGLGSRWTVQLAGPERRRHRRSHRRRLPRQCSRYRSPGRWWFRFPDRAMRHGCHADFVNFDPVGACIAEYKRIDKPDGRGDRIR